MPKNTRWVLVFDFETDSPDPETCNPVQLAAVPVNPETLEIKRDDSFNVVMKPPGIEKETYFTPEREKTIQWHANNYGCQTENVIEKWKKGTTQKLAWKNFCTFCAKYEVDKRPGQWYTEPIPAGYNIIGFDMVIMNRLAKKHKTKLPLSKVTKLDMMDNMFWWFENLEEPSSYKMDTLRTFFGMKAEGVAHDALQDVFDEAEIITRFMKFHRRQARVDKFKGAFA